MAHFESEKPSWELSKENIQPLSSGRKMACLTRSLETSLPHSETEMKDNICQFEEEIRNYSGSDPLEPWVRLINYLEQNCLSSGKFTHQYTVILGRCIRKFLASPLPSLLNDKRFVDILIKSSNGFQPEKRIVVLKSALSKGVGAKVSQMHIAIADNYEKLQEFKPALEQLRLGIAEGAHPLEPLEAALIDLEFRVAESVSKSMQASKDDQSLMSGLRSFGGSIPCAPTNEAPSIRIALSPACPSKSRPRNDLRSVPIFQGDAENAEPAEPLAPSNPFKEIEMMQNEKENQLEPTKWNERNNVIFSEAPERSVERIALYVDTDVTTGPVINQKTLQRPALSEIKIPDLPEIDESPNTLPVALIQPLAVTNVQELPQIPKVSEIVASESLDNDQICKPLPVLSPPARTNTPATQLLPPAPAPTGNIRIMYKKDQLWQNGREVSFEHLRALEYQKRGYGGLRKTVLDLHQVRYPSDDATKDKPASVIDRENQQIEELKRKVKCQADEFLKERHGLLDEISRLKSEHIDEVERRVTQAKNECIEAFHADQIQSSRDKSELLTALRGEKLRRLNLEDEHSNLVEEYRKLSIHDRLVTAEVERLKLQLSASQTVAQKSENATSNKFELFTDASLVASENIRPSQFEEQNKENVGSSEDKPRRTMTGVLQPSISAPPQALVFDEYDYDDTEVVLKRNETAVDFNVSNLTRALNFCPKPLGNSTPERGSSDSSEVTENPYSLRMPGITPLSYGGSSSGQFAALQNNILYQHPHFNQTLPNVQNLSTIQETSKENRSSCTTSSSSSNRTTASTFCTTGNFTRSASRHQ